MFYTFSFVFGLVMGSFISAYSYRLIKGLSIKKGRSFCPKCKKKIVWYDNIPLISYILLSGKCRKCRGKISIRYPLIELSTGLVFLLVAVFWKEGSFVLSRGEFLNIKREMGMLSLPYLYAMFFLLIVMFVTDIEEKVIFDGNIYFLFLISFLVILLFFPRSMYVNMLSAFGASSFLLLIHLATSGRGMGLGDVKLALPAGLILGWPGTLMWLYLSFVLGALIGLLLILFKKAKFGKHIPFGPFLIISFVFVFVSGEVLKNIIMVPLF